MIANILEESLTGGGRKRQRGGRIEGKDRTRRRDEVEGMMERRWAMNTRVTKVTKNNFHSKNICVFPLQLSLCRMRRSGYGRRRSIPLSRTDGCAG